VTRDQRRRMKARGILPVPQPVFMYEFGDLYIRNLGRARSEHAYPMRTWLEEGHHPAASSDCPVSTVDPFVNLFTMLTRKTNRGTVMGPEEALTAEQACTARPGAAPTRNSPRIAAARWSPACRPTSPCCRATSSPSTPEEILRDTRPT
jgi:predicted amidohydrolase YtcJ